VILIGLATLLLGQAHALGAAWGGSWVPDPYVVLLALAALHGGGRGLLPWAVGLGWGRALLMLEPVGLHVPCALFALWVVSGQRDAVDRSGTGALLVACLFAAGAWALAALVLGACTGQAPDIGLSLLSGTLLALVAAPPMRRVLRHARRTR
jgi:hypothetical protein